MYTLDLVTILRLLHEFRKSGILRAELATGVAQFKQPCVVIIELLAGEMLVCQVKEARGQNLLVGQDAYDTVAGLGKINWTFTILAEEELPSRRQTGKLGSGSLPAVTPQRGTDNLFLSLRVPRRLVDLNNAGINPLPRRYRQVYILIDGIRNRDKIAAMLSQPAQLVEEVLREMETAGIIAFF